MNSCRVLRSLLVATPLALAAGCASSTGSAPAQADARSEGEVFFERFQELADAFDPRFADLFAADATVRLQRESGDPTSAMNITGAQFQQLLLQTLPLSKASGDRSEYRNTVVEPTADGFVVRAVRYSVMRCYEDPNFEMQLRRQPSGELLISAMNLTSEPLNQCPDKPLGPILERVAAPIQQKLPVMADKESRLDALDVGADSLTYRYTLVNFTRADLDLETTRTNMNEINSKQVCIIPPLQEILDNGGTVIFDYADRNGEELFTLRFTEEACL